MACNLTLGRQEPCKDSIAGLAGAYFINYTSGSFILNTTQDACVSFPSSSTAYYYELKGANSYLETVNTSRDNGTTFFNQELSLTLKKLDANMTKQFKLLAYGRPQIVVADRNGNALLVGRDQGADMTGGTITIGAAYGDLSGYTAVFTGQEALPANFITGSTQANPFAGVGQPPTVVYGAAI